MKMLLVPYDPFAETSVEILIEEAMASHLLIYGSDLAQSLGYEHDSAFDDVIQSAIRACSKLRIAVRHHFLALYRQGEDGLYADWKLSRLACTLIVLHADVNHPEVVEAQFQILQKFM